MKVQSLWLSGSVLFLRKFQVWQGVRLGGILSTDLYKVYGNGFLDKLTVSGEGCHIGKISCVAPTVTDDLAVTASSPPALQKIVSSSVDFSQMERYLLQPVKSLILAILSQCRDRALKGEDINITMNGVQMPVVKELCTWKFRDLRIVKSQL